MSLYPSKVQHKLAWYQTRDSAVRGRLIPPSAMAHQGDLSNLPYNCPRVSFHHVDDKKYEHDLKYETILVPRMYRSSTYAI
jgi:hypothetical protein